MMKQQTSWTLLSGFILILSATGIFACGESESEDNEQVAAVAEKETGSPSDNSGNASENTESQINWELQPTPTNEALTAVFFIDENKGWVVG